MMDRVVYTLMLVFLFSSFVFSQFEVQTFLPNQQIQSIQIDTNQVLWLCDAHGNITHYDGYFFSTFSIGHKDELARLVLANGDMYLTSLGTTYSVEKGIVKTSKSVIDNPYLTQQDVNMRVHDMDAIIKTKTYIAENKYILTDYKGVLYILLNDKLRIYDIPDLPKLPFVNSIKEYKDKVYITTQDRGVYIWDKPQYMLHHVDTLDGLASNNVVDIQLDKDDNIWVATDGGLNVLSSTNDTKRSAPIFSYVRIWVDHKTVVGDSTDTHFSANSKGVVFEFKAIDLMHANEVEYQWTTFSDRDDWSPFTKTESIPIDELGPGQYSFQVRTTTDGKYFNYSQPISLVIEESLWDSYWPWVFCGIGLLSLIGFASSQSNNQAIKKIKEERDKIVIENKLLRSEQKTLQLQMNPHFLFNSLSAVQGLIALGQNKKARKHLQAFSMMMRSMLDQSRIETISLKDEITFLTQYLSLEKLARNDRFDFNFEVDDQLNTTIEIPPMILQPIVENAVVHGMKGLDRQGQIRIKISQKENVLLCTIEDNGVGRTLGSVANHISHGMMILQERIKTYMPSQKEILSIIDKKDENGNPLGTIVNVKLPNV